MRNDQPLFVVNRNVYPPSCLPVDVDVSELVDITRVSDTWRRYWNPHTRKEHVGADYYELMLSSSRAGWVVGARG